MVRCMVLVASNPGAKKFSVIEKDSPGVLIYSIFGWVVFSLTLNHILGYFLLGGAYGLWSLHLLIKTMKNLTVLKHPIIVKLGLLLGCSFCPVVLTTAEFSTMKPQEFIFIYIIVFVTEDV